MVKLNNDWDELLKDEFQKEYYQNLREFLKQEYSSKVIYPNMYNIFEALKHTSFKDPDLRLKLWSGSISRRKSSTWIGIFSSKRCENTTITFEYI